MNSKLPLAPAGLLLALLIAGCTPRRAATSATTRSASSAASPVATNAAPSLKATFKNDFLIGTALNLEQVYEREPVTARLIPEQFNAITPENMMKATHIHPEWNRYNFAPADKLVDYGQKYQLKINGHALVWHSQMPAFARRIKDADSLRQFFTEHINTVAGRYRGKVFSWDVVNEALEEDGSLRQSIFLRQLGEDYIIEAFRLAQKADPDAELYYNDYNIEQPRKRAGTIALIKKIQAAGVRIDGVGIQGHWPASKLPLKAIEESILAFSALGIKVMFTELDLTVLPNPWDHNTADISRTADGNRPGMNPYPNGLPDSVQAKLTQAYEDLFRLFLKHPSAISRITFWGVNDAQSWLNNFPIRGRTNYPLLFDRQNNPKPAFYAIIGARENNRNEN
ncbi:endo-1,4-beta-xylanase [Pseudoflavitalea sp. X16]|uniref:endo-1,4-beta-xylanase n=1 Tax=Paraflavitalea devenefica TaxID=2716334 RepID=UPI0014218758|nr:endo-1,4-beta-xylanase [Paraflavitalea devenefica]NII29302.1 endo-1,4-beta-xylanase [Paraflavitalea devenefica]